jgi:hypothetical protein
VTNVLAEEDGTNRSIVAVNYLNLENDIAIVVIQGIETNPPTIRIIRIPQNAGHCIPDVQGIQSVRKGVVNVPHGE